MEKPDLSEKIRALMVGLQAAQARVEDAVAEERRVRSLCCQATNDLNSAQHELDKALAELKAQAPRESDWGRECGQKTAIPV